MSDSGRHAVQPEQNLPLEEILKVDVPQERVERLKQLTTVDDPGVSDEVLNYLLRKQAQFVNMQYARFSGSDGHPRYDNRYS
jgi:hypothetical protein